MSWAGLWFGTVPERQLDEKVAPASRELAVHAGALFASYLTNLHSCSQSDGTV